MKRAKILQMLDNSRGIAAVYELTPPYGRHTHVVASSVSVLGMPECYLFPSDETGKILDYDELSGSQRGTVDHALVLGALGYEVTR